MLRQPGTAPGIDPAPDAEGLRLAVDNFALFVASLAEARGYVPIRRPGFLAVEGDERAGLRVLLSTPAPGADDLDAIGDLVTRRGAGGLTVEDPFGASDFGALGLKFRELPVMIRYPGTESEPCPAPAGVRRVDDPDGLAIAESVVVHGFALESFQPYRRGEALPAGLLDREEFDLFLAERDQDVAGTAMTAVDGAALGVYWVTTLPEHRSRGVGRTLMHAVLERAGDLPTVLTAATAGKPLYDSMGFRTVSVAKWWTRPQ